MSALIAAVSALIAAVVALVVATVVYRWQKTIDRETAIQSELRKLSAQFTASMHSLYLSQPFTDENHTDEYVEAFLGFSDAEKEAYVLRDQIYLLAPEEVASAVISCGSALRSWKNALSRTINQSGGDTIQAKKEDERFRYARRQVLEVMRTSLQKTVRVSLRSVVDEMRGIKK